MTKSERLQPIVKVSASRERVAARKLAEAMCRHREAEERLKELQRYRDEYEQLFQRDPHKGVGAEKLCDYRAFVAQLNKAIGYQQHKVNEAASSCDEARGAWLATRTRCRALDKVVDHHRRAERQDESRREQRDTDEQARVARDETAPNDGD